MSMTPKERILAVLNGEEPDKTPVCVYQGELTRLPGEWFRRLKERGLGLLRMAGFCSPVWSTQTGQRQDPGVPDVKYTRIEYLENGIMKHRQTWETPIGSITGVLMSNPLDNIVVPDTTEEYPVKQPSDWQVVNFIIKGIVDNLVPRYGHFERAEAELGDDGVAFVFLGNTAWQRAWMELAGPERAVIDFHEQPDEVQEYIDLQRCWHSRMAELVAGCPAKFIDIGEGMTDMISPRYFREYCTPIYQIYSQQLKGTGKVLGAHMEGRVGILRKDIAETPLNVIESFAVPPTGDISLYEVKKIWPDKMIFMNTAAHLAWAEPAEVREFYEGLAAEWGSKKGLLLELSEHLPVETVEAHMSAALDAFGY